MCVRVFISLLIAASAIRAQQANSSIQGQIVFPEGTTLSDFSVELREPRRNQRIVGKAAITKQGEFSFERVPASVLYVVRVIATSGKVMGEQIVNPVEGLSRVQVRLASKKAVPPPTATVSIKQLTHKIPPGALKEAQAADKALKKGDFTQLIYHLEKVVALDPEYYLPRMNLALAYLKTSQLETAIDHFRILIEINPRSPVPYAGLSTAYYDLHRFADAETAARRAIALDPGYELGHFLLGSALAVQDKDHEQALRHLAKSSAHFPAAFITSAGILARSGQREEAEKSIQAYFDSGEISSLSQAEDLLTMLY